LQEILCEKQIQASLRVALFTSVEQYLNVTLPIVVAKSTQCAKIDEAFAPPYISSHTSINGFQ
jgi:hypothetical protein